MPSTERLQKIISAAGIASRRKAELLILQGRVTVNGQVTTVLGTKADPRGDHIKVDGKLIRHMPRKVYVLLNKPKKVLSTVSDPHGRTKVTDLIDTRENLYPVGRLDYETEGLILLTNDGEFARILAGAGDRFPKIYQVKVHGMPEDAVLERLRAGMRLKDGTRLSRCKIVLIKPGRNPWFEVTLTQGRNRQIREMFESQGHPVQKLRRTHIGFIAGKGLPIGGYRFLSEEEIRRVFTLGARARNQPPETEGRRAVGSRKGRSLSARRIRCSPE
jgi:23S rRNA pseudouridine2605 synthase